MTFVKLFDKIVAQKAKTKMIETPSYGLNTTPIPEKDLEMASPTTEPLGYKDIEAELSLLEAEADALWQAGAAQYNATDDATRALFDAAQDEYTVLVEGADAGDTSHVRLSAFLAEKGVPGALIRTVFAEEELTKEIQRKEAELDKFASEKAKDLLTVLATVESRLDYDKIAEAMLSDGGLNLGGEVSIVIGSRRILEKDDSISYNWLRYIQASVERLIQDWEQKGFIKEEPQAIETGAPTDDVYATVDLVRDNIRKADSLQRKFRQDQYGERASRPVH